MATCTAQDLVNAANCLMSWFCKGVNWTPSPVNSVQNGRDLYFKNPSQFRHVRCNSVYGENPASACIFHLLHSCFPFAISGFVISIVVYSSDCKSSRFFSHVGKKIFKRVPSFTNGNPPSTISVVVLSSRVLAPRKHGCPTIVSSRKGFIFGVAVCETGRFIAFPSEASTGTLVSVSKNSAIRDDCFPAFTNTNNSCSRFSVFISGGSGVGNHFKSSKCSSDKAYFSGHNDVTSLLLSRGGRPNAIGARHDLNIRHDEAIFN